MHRNVLLTFLAFIGLVAHSQESPLTSADFFSSAEIAAANTALEVDYITVEEKNIFLYCNLSRLYPRKFYLFYRAFLDKDNRLGLLKSEYYHRTLGEELQTMKPMDALLPDKKMYGLAECWAKEAGDAGHVGHDRISCVGGFSGECCSYGWDSGLQIVFQLLIDQGVESLGHRKIIFSSGYKGMGTAIRNHSGYGHNAVLDFTYTNDILRAEAEVKRLAEVARQAELDRRMELRKIEFSTLMSQWTKKEKANADVCRSLSYLNDFEKELYFYINLIRLYPGKFKKLIWDNGPYFDQFLEDQQNDLHREAGYRRVAQTLSGAKGGVAFVPDKKSIQAGRCVIKEYSNGASNPTDCYFKAGFRSWWIQTFFPQETYNDIIQIFLSPKDFNNIFFSNATIVIDNDEYQGSILTLKK
ncbi:MAG: CAP domain-containing protein [Cytophagales bacterium]|nr:CAP domain-containing protein [Cytophagales bacterium]